MYLFNEYKKNFNYRVTDLKAKSICRYVVFSAIKI